MVYILLSERARNWSYVGFTKDLHARLVLHNRGKTKSTKGYRPLKIIHSEQYSSKEEARKRELFLKSGFGREEKYQIIAEYHSRIV